MEKIVHDQHRLMSFLAGTFPKFGRLPAEIRKIIWHMALPESRAFVLYIGYPDKICLNQYYKPPSIRGVCKESWDVTEKNGGFEFANVQTETYGIWFNYSKDVVVWLEYDLYDQFMILKNIQNIAIEWHHFCDEDDCINTLQWVLETMPQCQSVILMTRPQLCNGPEDLDGCTAQLFSMNGTDVIPASSLGDTWAHVKKRLQALYHKRSTIRKLGTGAAELPIVEAKELIFNPKKVY